MSAQTVTLIILGAALATYVTRIGGHVVLSQFRRIHPRVEAALNAVPAAVLATLVAPSLLTGGVAEIAALVASALLSLRAGPMAAFLAGAAVLLVMRSLGL
ncbi:MAG: AzlD domain-containing protein [Nitratireductor sp.]|nr:AzlD domain-containing protein [Nitratireductor sp.]MCB1459583.1 AzlD domain-containing protein [Nitratireductor sp.]